MEYATKTSSPTVASDGGGRWQATEPTSVVSTAADGSQVLPESRDAPTYSAALLSGRTRHQAACRRAAPAENTSELSHSPGICGFPRVSGAPAPKRAVPAASMTAGSVHSTTGASQPVMTNARTMRETAVRMEQNNHPVILSEAKDLLLCHSMPRMLSSCDERRGNTRSSADHIDRHDAASAR